ncbi:hypothetical protein C5O80_14395 [Burkholderia sp. SRS-46]|nr:hypothetical protein C5O80_14395 [Burkholderia sp. SRS-46]
MRLILAALLGAAAFLPPFAHATTALPDPADAAAPVPAHAAVPSAFDGYRPYRDGEGPGWRQLNRAVTEPARRAATPGKPADAPHSNHTNHATHGSPAR